MKYKPYSQSGILSSQLYNLDTEFDFDTEPDLHRTTASGFHRAFAAYVAC